MFFEWGADPFGNLWLNSGQSVFSLSFAVPLDIVHGPPLVRRAQVETQCTKRPSCTLCLQYARSPPEGALSSQAQCVCVCVCFEEHNLYVSFNLSLVPSVGYSHFTLADSFCPTGVDAGLAMEKSARPLPMVRAFPRQYCEHAPSGGAIAYHCVRGEMETHFCSDSGLW